MSSEKCDLRFGSILSYVPLKYLEDGAPDAADLPREERARKGCAKRGIEDRLCGAMLDSHNIMWHLKSNHVVSGRLIEEDREVEMSELVARLTKMVLANELGIVSPIDEIDWGARFRRLLGEFLVRDALLVPVPPHYSQVKDYPANGGLWVPDSIAMHMERLGLGRRLVALQRERAVPKSSTLLKRTERRTTTHYESLRVISDEDLNGKRVVLVDDVVTTGSTLLGSAWRILDRYPNAQIVGFAAMRTISDLHMFRGPLDPVAGCIVHNENCTTYRRP
ncbi:MAG: phosphoribosyltransferase family protein [Nitrososphaeria archaeon]